MNYTVTHKDGKIEHYDSESKVIGLHRIDGPAIEWPNGDVWYCQYNKLHRLDGPAIVRSNGNNEYWIEGLRISKEQFEEIVNPQPSLTQTVETVIINDEKKTEIVVPVSVVDVPQPASKRKKK